jgi:hypothetical protein
MRTVPRQDVVVRFVAIWQGGPSTRNLISIRESLIRGVPALAQSYVMVRRVFRSFAGRRTFVALASLQSRCVRRLYPFTLL